MSASLGEREGRALAVTRVRVMGACQRSPCPAPSSHLVVPVRTAQQRGREHCDGRNKFSPKRKPASAAEWERSGGGTEDCGHVRLAAARQEVVAEAEGAILARFGRCDSGRERR